MQARRVASANGRIVVVAVGQALLVAGLAAFPALASDHPMRPPTATMEPIELAADRIETWQEESTRIVHLRGHAAIVQGVEGRRCHEAIVRIETSESAAGPPTFTVLIHAEQVTPLTGSMIEPLAQAAETWTSRAGVNLKPPHDGRPVQTRDAEPPRLAIAARARASRSAEKVDTPPAPPVDLALAPAAAPSPPQTPPPPPIDGPPPTPAPFVPPPVPTQFNQESGNAFPDLPPEAMDDPAERPQFEGNTEGLMPDDVLPSPELDPLPEFGGIEGDDEVDPTAPIVPGTARVINIYPRDDPQGFKIGTPFAQAEDGTLVFVVTGGVQIVMDDPKQGTIDLTADQAVIWTKAKTSGGGGITQGANAQSADQPFEVYLQGNVRFLQDKRELAGPGDQVEYKADRFYADINKERFLALDAELEQYSSGLVAPLRTMAESIFQYRDIQQAPGGGIQMGKDGNPILGLARIQAEKATVTGSQFANPGYRFNSRSVEITELPPGSNRGPFLQRLLNPLANRRPTKVNLIDARQNLFFLGPVPYFYYPRFLTTSEDLDPPLRQIGFRTNNLFGQMFLTDWDMFKLLAVNKPDTVEDWNLDLDYLSDRGFAYGSEFGYFGNDLSTDILGRDLFPGLDGSYFGYLDHWSLNDSGIDNLGGGTAVVTNYPPGVTPRNFPRTAVPPFQDYRGRILFRHMQSLLGVEADPLEDFRIQVEASYTSDRNFLEQYYNRLFATGLDQANRAIGIRQWRNQTITLWTEGNAQNWYTDTQWLPKLDYYHLGGAPLGLDRFIQYYNHSGINYANTHTASEVNNQQVFAFIPYDPTSLTSQPFRSGRAYTNHELQVPIRLNFLRVVPYVQGQVVGWDNQYEQPLPSLGFVDGLDQVDYVRGAQGSQITRLWGAFGGKLDFTVSRPYTGVENELLNIHGLMHKANFYADYRYASSNEELRRFGIQDDLDDNTYEYIRRYFAMSTYQRGVLPAQYNPLLLTLRRGSSPITSTVDVQDSIQTVRLGVMQRLQTKRGPFDRRHIIDWMTLDIGTTYFPQAGRDNFGKSWGQSTYTYEWFIGDRTSIVSTGWFDSFPIQDNLLVTNGRNREGLQVIMTGVNFTRIPRTTLSLMYGIINTGPINSSALNASAGYWLSPKWYSTFGGLYDFGEGLLLNTNLSITRIGADFLTTAGFSVSPLQNNYSFVFELVPRFSPSTRLGSGGNGNRPDLRYLPTQ